MKTSARLFQVEDIISTLTGAPLAERAQAAPEEILSHVIGYLIPADRASPLHKAALEILRQQLPPSLKSYTIADLARFVIDEKVKSHLPLNRLSIIKSLQITFGDTIPICCHREHENESNGLKSLIKLIENPQKNKIAH